MAREWRETLEEMVSAPHKLVKDQMVTISHFCDYALIFDFFRPLALPLCLSPRISWKAVMRLQKRITS
jgi:hypothetical protein